MASSASVADGALSLAGRASPVGRSPYFGKLVFFAAIASIALIYVDVRLPDTSVEGHAILRYGLTGAYLGALVLLTMWDAGLAALLLIGLTMPVMILYQKQAINYSTPYYATLLFTLTIWFARPLPKHKNIPGLLLFSGLLLWMVLETLRTQFIANATAYLLQTFAMLSAMYVICTRLEAAEINAAFDAFFIGAVLTALWLLLRYDWGGGSLLYGGSRLGLSIGSNPTGIAALGSFALLYGLTASRSNLPPWLLFLGSGVLALEIIWTGSRGGTLATLLGILGAVVVQRNVVKSFVMISLPIAAGAIFWTFASQYSSILKRFLALFLERDLSQVTSHRSDIWREALNAFKAQPLIGTGLANVASFSGGAGIVGRQDKALTAHSLYLTLLSDTGLIGTTLFVLWSVVFFAYVLRKTGWAPLAVAWLIAFQILGAASAFNLELLPGFMFAGLTVVYAARTTQPGLSPSLSQASV